MNNILFYYILIILLLIITLLSTKSKFESQKGISTIVYVECDSMGIEISNSSHIFIIPVKNEIIKLPIKNSRTEYIKFITFDLPSPSYRLYSTNFNVPGYSSPPIILYGLMINTPYKTNSPGNFYINIIN